MPRVLLALPVLLAAAFFAAPPAFGAELEVVVRERGGGSLSGEQLRLESLDRPGRSSPEWSGETDAGGAVSFQGLEPGRYLVRLFGPRRVDLVNPLQNPFTPAPVVTLLEGDAQSIVLELWPGTRVRTRLVLPDDRHSAFKLRFVHRGTGTAVEQGFPRDSDVAERMLPPGLWDVSMVPESGYLLAGFEVEGQSQAGSSALLDLSLLGPVVDLAFTYVAPCLVTGSVSEASGKKPAVSVEASLLGGGEWLEAAERRGGSSYRRVTARVDTETGRYEMRLPDGAWSLRPVAPDLVSSEPEQLELRLAPGEEAAAHFRVRLGRDTRDAFVVRIRDDRDRAVSDAIVEAFPLGDDTAPARVRTRSLRGYARLEGAPEGDLLVVANHPDFLEGQLELTAEQIESGVQHKLHLWPAARFLFDVRDVLGEPLAGVDLEIERDDEPVLTRSRDPEVRRDRQRRRVTSDSTGRALASGFAPGHHVLRGLTGSTTSRIEVRLAGAGRFAEKLEVEIEGSGEIEVEVREVPSASLGATLACRDSFQVPDAVSVRVVEASAPLPADVTGRQAPGESVFSADGLVLGGKRRDQLSVGPLPDGVYRLALRPGGFDRWTWAHGTSVAAESSEFPVRLRDLPAGGVRDLGEIQLECGPAVDLLGEVAGGGTFPALDEVEVEARLVDDEGRDAAPPPRVEKGAEKGAGRFELRGLEPGKPRLDLVLEHPHFLPEPRLGWDIPLVLERGRFQELVLEVEALGGALEVAVRNEYRGRVLVLEASTPSGEPVRRVESSTGKILLPSLEPGRYRVRLLASAGETSAGETSAGEEVASWDAVEVRRGITVRLAPPG